jgi:hypothetical protein
MDKDYAERARALVGTSFRPQGRARELGLDCIGLVLAVFGLPADEVRRDYRLRGDHRSEMLAAFAKHFRRVSTERRRIGDVLVLQVAPEQMHLAVLTASGFVHADARRGKVVETPGMPPWSLLAVFRRRVRTRGSS